MLHLNGIFGWLVRYLMCGAMLFAAGDSGLSGAGAGIADIGGDGSGEGDGGGDDFAGSGAGDGGDDFAGGDDDTDQDEDTDGQGKRQTEQQRADAARDARLPANVKKALETLKASDPKAAEVLRRAMFADTAWKSVFPAGIRQAREMAQTFEEVGGAEGVRAIQEQAQSLEQELNNIDESWEKADPQFIESWATENPEAFGRVVPIALEQLRKVDKDGYNFTLGRIFHNTLSSSGVLDYLSQMYNLAQANKAAPGMAGIIEGLAEISKWSTGIRELASHQPERKPDAGMKRLAEERTKFQNEQFTAFKKEVGSEIRTHLESGLVTNLGKFLAQRNIKIAVMRQKEPDRFMAMVAEADRRLTSALNGDKAFQAQKDRIVATRDKARVVKFYKSKIDYLLSDPAGPQIAKKVSKVFFSGGMNTQRGAGNGGN